MKAKRKRSTRAPATKKLASAELEVLRMVSAELEKGLEALRMALSDGSTLRAQRRLRRRISDLELI